MFGSVHGGNTASRVAVRVSDVDPAPPVRLPKQNQEGYYLFHFASASGKGIRYNDQGCLSPGTRFRVRLATRGPALDPVDAALLDRALTAFCRLGCLGLRATRGLGAVAMADAASRPDLDAFIAWCRDLESANIEVAAMTDAVAARDNVVTTENAMDAMALLESCLRTMRKETFPEKNERFKPSPLGRSGPGRERQSSGVRLCPVRLRDGRFLPVVFYVPAVVESKARRPDFRLAGTTFRHPFQGEPNAKTHTLRRLGP